MTALARALASSAASRTANETVPVFYRTRCAVPRPYVGGRDEHTHHRSIKEEHRTRQADGVLVHRAQNDYSMLEEETRVSHYPTLPTWWPKVETPVGFPARLPDMAAYFGSHLQLSPTGDVAIYFSTSWLVEVIRG